MMRKAQNNWSLTTIWQGCCGGVKYLKKSSSQDKTLLEWLLPGPVDLFPLRQSHTHIHSTHRHTVGEKERAQGRAKTGDGSSKVGAQQWVDLKEQPEDMRALSVLNANHKKLIQENLIRWKSQEIDPRKSDQMKITKIDPRKSDQMKITKIDPRKSDQMKITKIDPRKSDQMKITKN